MLLPVKRKGFASARMVRKASSHMRWARRIFEALVEKCIRLGFLRCLFRGGCCDASAMCTRMPPLLMGSALVVSSSDFRLFIHQLSDRSLGFCFCRLIVMRVREIWSKISQDRPKNRPTEHRGSCISSKVLRVTALLVKGCMNSVTRHLCSCQGSSGHARTSSAAAC